MSSPPSLSEIKRRFNAACEAFDAAIDASTRRDGETYDAELLQAARDMGSALDLGAIRCLCVTRHDLLRDAQRAPFPELLRQITALKLLRLSDERIQDLRRWRDMRNRAEHPPIKVPGLSNLLEALSGTREFLVDAFSDSDDLSDPDAPSVIHAISTDNGTSTPWNDSHRRVSPESWIRDQLTEGLARLNAGRPNNVLPAKEVRKVLTGLAFALIEPLNTPDAPLPLGILENALGKYGRLYFEASWLVTDASSVRFRDPRLPALLVGLDMGKRIVARPDLRTNVGSRREWREAAWAATASGDADTEWFTQLLDARDWDRLPDRVVTACAALAGLRPQCDDGLFEQVADTASTALVWMVPVINPERLPHNDEVTDPWRLERTEWQRAALDLALGTEFLPSKATIVDWKHPLGTVGKSLSALALPPRLSDASTRAALTFLRPWASNGVSPLDRDFFHILCSLQDGLESRFELHFLKIWMAEIGARALWQGDPQSTARMMVVPDSGHPAGLLLNYEDLHSDWCEAWTRFVEYEEPTAAAHAWVKAAVWVAKRKPTDRVTRFLLDEAPKKLQSIGAWEMARAALEKELGPNVPPARPDEQQIQYGARLFSLPGLPGAAWRSRIAEWAAGSHLPWRVLVEAGAPHDAITTWCIAKIRQKMAEAPHIDGPVGIIASPGTEILSTNGWQFAFEQARDALDWLLAHGDEGAVGLLAEACFPPDRAERFGPTMAKFAGLHVPLWQVLWGQTITRSDGRAALFARAERCAPLGEYDVHFIPTNGMSTLENVWDTIAWLIAAPVLEQRQSPSKESSVEAHRLFHAFNRWLESRPMGRLHREPSRDPWSDPVARTAKSLVLLCCAAYGVNVAAPLQTTLSAIVEDGHVHEQPLLRILGGALGFLCKHLEHPTAALLQLAATPRVAERLAIDEATTFWTALLRELGIERITQLVDTLNLPDMGLGFFDALAVVAPNTLAEYQTRPDLLRSVLLRSAEGRFMPSASFHERAWANPRRPEDVPDIDKIPAGEWLQHFLEQSRAWPASDRQHFLRTLAQRSQDDEIRRRCVQELLD